MIPLSFIGTPSELMEYLNFAEWCVHISKGFKLTKVFDDLSGFTAE